MARRRGVLQSYVAMQSEVERQRIAQQRAQAQARKAAERAQREYERARVADEKERQRLYIESRQNEAEISNQQIEAEYKTLRNILTEAIQHDHFFDVDKLKRPPEMPAFSPGRLGIPETPPDYAAYTSSEPSIVQKMLLGAKERWHTMIRCDMIFGNLNSAG